VNPNVLLVVLDAVRARNTSLHGYERETTPYLERFAERATTYTQARAPSVMSIQSHASIFTGLHAVEHQLRDVDQRLRPGHTIWERLATEGYETGVFSYNSYLTQAPLGLADAFDTVESGDEQRLPHPGAFDPANLTTDGIGRYREFLSQAWNSGRFRESVENGLALWGLRRALSPDDRGFDIVRDEVFTDRFLEWEAEREGPWAACINYMSAHSPYVPRREHDKWGGSRELEIMREVDDHAWSFIAGRRPWSERKALENLYDGCIHEVDAELQRLTQKLQARGDLEETLVVITADHGEGFGEPGEVRPARSVAHGNSGGIEEGILHVPLVVKRPEQSTGQEIERPASLTAFPKAVRRIRENGDGTAPFVPTDEPVFASSFGFMPGDRERAPDYVEDVSVYQPPGRAIYLTTDEERIHKHVEWNGETVGFDCTDPRAIEPLSVANETIVENAFDTLSPADIVVGDTAELTDEVKDRLSELGYR